MMMSQPIILSDEEDHLFHSTPIQTKKRRTQSILNPTPTVVLLDDDPTPKKPDVPIPKSFDTASFGSRTRVSNSEHEFSDCTVIPETPMSDIAILKCSSSKASSDFHAKVSDQNNKFSEEFTVIPDTPMSDTAIAKCSRVSSVPKTTTVSSSEYKFSDLGINRLICLESDNDSEDGYEREKWKGDDILDSGFDAEKDFDWNSKFVLPTRTTSGHADETQIPEDRFSNPVLSPLRGEIPQVSESPGKEYVSTDQIDNIVQNNKTKDYTENKNSTRELMRRKGIAEEEKIRLKEEKKLKKLQEKAEKAALKAEAVELKKIEKERKKWENGKFALKSIVAEIDAKVIEMGSVGGSLLTRFAEKGLTYRITSNPIEKSICWTMKFPEHIPELSPEGIEIQYVLLVYEAEEFCNLVTSEAFLDHVSGVRSRYPSHTVCYLTNRLMSFINKREQEQFKNPTNHNGWRRPPVEEMLAKLTTHFVKVRSRQCVDEAELAEHIVGLTSSLASCQFRKKLTRLSVNANGSLIPKDSVDRNLIQKNLWLKALVAIPKVQPRFAIAIWKKYPTMKSLLIAYMDPSKSVHEKEFLLKDLTVEGLIGDDRRLGEVCSKRVYRILMAQSGSIKTDDVENGAAFFAHQSS
ncbi:crossover junction endonuclease EME1B isoform X3 [Cannabis sativa]|uniref:crossover junction endonuclease EME1B isoform X3 n=1 Tax=Cannabis sativa TaxID=3483 RepID=UPI0029C9DA03|nr:crossover junction endonuclease EME1B isoform X3 [Cannabis sativa]XP_030498874.2 crossover junction endonuclease EME1B isoform X3 [Cannabis sativa]